MTKWVNLLRKNADGWYHQPIQSQKWDATDDQSKHTLVSAAVFEKVTAAFSVYGENGLEILSFDSFDCDDQYECEIEIKLPGGVILEVDSESYIRPMTIPETTDEAAELVSLCVSCCADFGFEKLSDKLDDLRSELNKLLEQWSEDGDAHIDFVDYELKKNHIGRTQSTAPFK